MGQNETKYMAVTGLSDVHADLRWPMQTGIGNVMKACMERLPDDLNIVSLRIDAGLGSPSGPFAISKALRGNRDGVFWSPGFVPPAWHDGPSVVTVHDLTHLHYYSRWHRMYYDVVFRHMYRRCESIICVSDFTRREFLEWSKVDPKRVHVVYNGVDPAFGSNTQRREMGFPYVLYPGNRRSYKNLDRLMVAYARSTLPARGVHLMVTGDSTPAINARARELGISWRMHFAGRVEDADMPALYKGAEAIVLISLYEGFGLPIIEAMASRVPVLTSNVSSMPEVAADAALLVDPLSVPDVTRGLERIVFDVGLRDELSGRGLERAQQFDWNRSATEVWDIVRDAAQAA